MTSAAAGPAQQAGASFARGAALIAGLTIFSRILGLARTLVFSQTVGAGCLGTAYVTANQVPNLIYELVLGGALASAMVPVLARPAARAAADPAEKARVAQISSALLTWSVIILVPLTLCVAGGARRADSVTPQPGQCQRTLRPCRGGRDHQPDDRGIRSADPPVRTVGRALRAAAGLPPVHWPGAGAGAVQPGGHRLLSRVRVRGPRTPAVPALPRRRADPV